MKKFRLGVYALLALVVSTTAAFAVPGVIKSDTTLHAGPSLDSAAACRDRFFQSYCERIVSSQPVLDQYLVRNLSSIRVY